MRYLKRPQGRFEMSTGEEVLDPTVEERLLADGSGGDPTAQSGVLEGLRIVSQGVPALTQLGL